MAHQGEERPCQALWCVMLGHCSQAMKVYEMCLHIYKGNGLLSLPRLMYQFAHQLVVLLQSALGAFYSTPECQHLTVACKVSPAQ